MKASTLKESVKWYGIYTFPDGKKYDGQWLQDQHTAEASIILWIITVMTVCGTVITSMAKVPQLPYRRPLWRRLDKWQAWRSWYLRLEERFQHIGSWKDDKKNGEGTLVQTTYNTTVNGRMMYMLKARLNMPMVISMWVIGKSICSMARVFTSFIRKDRYEGSYVQGERTGEGIYYHASGNKYVGKLQEIYAGRTRYVYMGERCRYDDNGKTTSAMGHALTKWNVGDPTTRNGKTTNPTVVELWFLPTAQNTKAVL